jgi:hypothetical protein
MKTMNKIILILSAGLFSTQAYALGGVTSGGLDGQYVYNCANPSNTEGQYETLTISKQGEQLIANYSKVVDSNLTEQVIEEVYKTTPYIGDGFGGSQIVSLTVVANDEGTKEATLLLKDQIDSPIFLICQ